MISKQSISFSWGGRVKHCVSLILFSLIFYSAAYGQIDEDDEDVLPFVYNYEQAANDAINAFSPGNFPSVTKSIVVTYESSGQAYLEFVHSEGLIVYYGVGSEPINLTSAALSENGSLLLTNLPLNQTITIWQHNEINAPAKLWEFSTHSEKNDIVEVGAEIFYAISGYLKTNEPSEDLYTLVSNLQNVHYLEKSSFIQHFFYRGENLLDVEQGGVPVRPVIDADMESNCLCRPLRLTLVTSADPIGGAVGNANDGFYTPYTDPSWPPHNYGRNNRARAWQALGYDGPGKYHQIWQEASQCASGVHIKSAGSPVIGNSFGQTAKINMVFACVGLVDMKPEDCPCERPLGVRYCWKYGAEATAHANIISGGLCNEKSAMAGVKDIAAVFADYEDTPTGALSNPIDGGTVIAGVGCGVSFDEGKLIVNIGKTLLSGYAAIKGLPVDNPYIKFVVGQYLKDKFKDDFSTLFKNNYSDKEGACGTATASGFLADGCKTYILMPNRTFTVAIVSDNFLTTECGGRFAANARLLSSYSLSAAIAPSEIDQVGENCCNNGAGAYTLGCYWGGYNTATAQGDVRSNFIASGLSVNPNVNLSIVGEFGTRGGGQREGCGLVIMHERHSEESHNEAVTSNRLNCISISGSRVSRNQELSDLLLRFELLDLNGRLLADLDNSIAGQLLFDFSSTSLPSGHYVLRLSGNKHQEVLKVFHP